MTRGFISKTLMQDQWKFDHTISICAYCCDEGGCVRIFYEKTM